MKKSFLAIAMFLAANALFAQTTVLKTEADSLNYAHGVSVGANAQRVLGNRANMQLFLEAMTAAMKGQPTLIDQASAPKIEQFIQNQPWSGSNMRYLEQNKTRKGVTTTNSGLQYEVITKGNGTVSPKATDKVEVHYHGTFIDGNVFDSSVNRGQTAKFGLNQVIPGWTEGLQLMKEGDKYKFTIPYNLAYGERGRMPNIKGFSTLIFEVELIKVNP